MDTQVCGESSADPCESCDIPVLLVKHFGFVTFCWNSVHGKEYDIESISLAILFVVLIGLLIYSIPKLGGKRILEVDR